MPYIETRKKDKGGTPIVKKVFNISDIKQAVLIEKTGINGKEKNRLKFNTTGA